MATERPAPPDLRDPACFARVFAAARGRRSTGRALVGPARPGARRGRRAGRLPAPVAAARGLRPGAGRPRPRSCGSWRARGRSTSGGEGEARDRRAPPRRGRARPPRREPRRRSGRSLPRRRGRRRPHGVVLRSAERARLRVALGTLPPEQRQRRRARLRRWADGGGDRRARRDPARHGQEPRAPRAPQAPRRAARRRASPAEPVAA